MLSSNDYLFNESISPFLTTPSDTIESDFENDHDMLLNSSIDSYHSTDSSQKVFMTKKEEESQESTTEFSSEIETDIEDMEDEEEDFSIPPQGTFSMTNHIQSTYSSDHNHRPLGASKENTIEQLNRMVEANLKYKYETQKRSSGNLTSLRTKTSQNPSLKTPSFLSPYTQKKSSSHKKVHHNYIKYLLPEKDPFKMPKAQRSYLDYCHYYYNIRLKRKQYLHRLQETDTNVGKILKEIFHTSYRNNTIIVFTSDCGGMIGNRGMFFCSSASPRAVGFLSCWIQ